MLLQCLSKKKAFTKKAESLSWQCNVKSFCCWGTIPFKSNMWKLFFLVSLKASFSAVSWLWEWWSLCTNPQYRAFRQKWEEWPIPLGVGQPFRRISTGQRDGQRGTVWNSTNADAQSCIWGGTTPGTSTDWGWPAGEQLCRAGPGGAGASQSDSCYDSVIRGFTCPTLELILVAWDLTSHKCWCPALTMLLKVALSVQWSTVIYLLLSMGICNPKYLSSKYL